MNLLSHHDFDNHSNPAYFCFRSYGCIRRIHWQRPDRIPRTSTRRREKHPLVRRIPDAVPILGYFAASTFSKYVTQFDHWIIFALLVFIGGNMVHEAFEEDEENSKETAQFDWKHMLPLAVACSIDAFAVGVSLAFMFTKAHMAFAILSIGVVTGLFSAAGLHIGRAFGSRWQKPAQIAGGVVLILLGIKVLLEHLGVIAF